MEWSSTLLLYGLLIGVFLFTGSLIGSTIGIVGIVGVTIASGMRMWPTFGDIIWNTTTSFTLVAIPLFVLMGEIILRSGLARRFYGGVADLLRGMPGGLAHANIVGCAAFSALAGSTVATALTVGTVAVPEMRRQGYSDVLTLGSLTGGGCLGILIPPSIPMIIYASITQTSVLAIFMAGVVPGLLLALAFMFYIGIRAMLQPDLIPPRVDKALMRSRWKAARDSLPVAGLIAAVIGSMYFGIVTPTEAAGFGCLLALFLGLLYRDLTAASLLQALRNAVLTSCVVMFITIFAQFLSFAVVNSGVSRGLSDALAQAGVGPFTFFCLMILVYGVIGMFIDGLSIMLLTVPVLFPVFQVMGYDPIWVGVVLVMLIELGALTPPMGLNLFAVQSISNAPLGVIGRSSLPYAVIILGCCLLLYAVPQIALALPELMRR
ncbi:MAG: TRAP transporter large permease subunit [Alphaproteobacteria bacterium]|nr:TRAP transporter large permease subunit [Alphaproteobacteria bacterium]MBU1551468.1 TRAP transporter large permease subunit [Alphaproteobacteria bacterium]MBU2334696.1 TRAP transporter large permease subunit [Alphaproteobacteria bacterium]MBU2386418.1 TRAP transporter large permease subunit [Alphaproteobacteria bacterium]